MPESKKESFSYRVNVGHLSINPVSVTLEADERERAELADRWGVTKVNALKADLELLRWKRDGVRIKGRVQVDLEQECVVTLEPVQSHIDEAIDALFVPDGSRLARIPVDETGEMIVDAEGPDLPETFTGDSIDVGLVCEEFIVLAIDPYPRKEGAVLEAAEETPPEEDRPPSPFAGLKDWSKR
ncbi:YceD family protein [Hoeflea prorocentri]|uniref:DUF177 domain-containing protein n=1 Tax=Hoeflea prorocentri TaxID=1922333 RepID=A0A9X3UI13_9HYPH|nr:DUF177 domain-containing protein [Hoeflea prorocentri]MCY6381233.1 DUF177 domain-containing protein [Hoeflea prorocentri]MDA5399033.1 DUF177 domain-containing protein [Hoeflea prorocentri]